MNTFRNSLIASAIGLSLGFASHIDDSVTTPVPEPETLGLLALGFAGVGLARRKRKN
jgi:hypothetical protein